ncbi:hypothetical protein QCA50_000145 [Cerrena zonata]|uniref:Uncharacterized protein n=1 Tax=Cerrena zonata TaxID=2478898 RepID=A0AAW0GW23_9APHY
MVGRCSFTHKVGYIFETPIYHVITDEDIRDETILEKLNAACEWLGLPSEMEQDIHVAASTKPPVVIFVNHDHAIASFKRDLINQGIEDIGIHRCM